MANGLIIPRKKKLPGAVTTASSQTAATPVQEDENSPQFVTAPLLPAGQRLAFANLANALLPFFSSQDQQSVMTFLNTQDPKGLYKNYLGRVPSLGAQRATEEARSQFLSAGRANEALRKLNTMRKQAHLTEEQLGSGYKFIKQAIGLLKTLGARTKQGELSMTRAEFESMQSQLNALMSQARGDRSLAPYAELANKFLNPTLIGELNPTSTVNGNTVYGKASRKLFT